VPSRHARRSRSKPIVNPSEQNAYDRATGLGAPRDGSSGEENLPPPSPGTTKLVRSWWTNEITDLFEERGNFGFWSRDLLTGEIYWSPGFYRLLGLEPDSQPPSYELFVSLVHPDDRPLVDVSRLASDRGFRAPAGDFEFRVIRPSGSMRWIASRLDILSDRAGTPIRSIGVIFDASPIHDAVGTLELTDARFRALAAAVPGAAWLAQPDGSTESIANWLVLTGRSLGERAGIAWIEAVHEDDRPGAQRAWQEAAESRKPFSIRHRIRVGDGEAKVFVSSGVPVQESGGAIREWIGVTVETMGPLDSPVEEGRDDAAALAITSAQIRAGRGILNWSVRDLSDATQISPTTIRRLERIDAPIPAANSAAQAIRRAFEAAGLELLFPEIGAPAIRPR
jgi:PAS domain-containing protein